MTSDLWCRISLALSIAMMSLLAVAEDAFKIDGKTYTVKSLFEEDESAFFEIEKQRYELISRLAEKKYLDKFWEEKAKKEKKSVEQVRDEYLKKNIKVTDADVKATLEQFKDHPQLKKMSKQEQEMNVRKYLESSAMQEVLSGIIASALAKKELVIVYPEPKEPIFKLTINEHDPVKYGPNATDTKPLGCKGDACAITIVEYSEFQCPFCTRVLPTAKRILTDYKGKVRWIVRDFPLSFHDRAKPAAIAAKCAQAQGKYWEMYDSLFENQRNLSDSDFTEYAKKIGLDKAKFETCYKKPGAWEKRVDENFESGQKYGVSGTPAFFINGRRLSGALPYDKFKEIIDDELAGSKRKS